MKVSLKFYQVTGSLSSLHLYECMCSGCPPKYEFIIAIHKGHRFLSSQIDVAPLKPMKLHQFALAENLGCEFQSERAAKMIKESSTDATL